MNKTQSGRVLLTKRLTVDKLVSELENQGIEVLPYVFTEDEYSKIYDLKNITELKSNHSVYINSNIQSYDDANFLDLIQNRLQEKESRYKVEYQFPIMISEDGNVRFLLPNTYRGVKYEWFSDTNGFLDFDKAYFETDLENFSKIILQ
ncbi:MAG: hypothetical protein FWG79_08900 [Bacteroidales bacterium]|nr:hypothetical protein [Bacteroidales bacterium]